MLGMSKADPSTVGFNDIFFAAANGMTGQTPDNFDDAQKKPSVWPILTFLSFIFVTPYLIMKLIGQVSTAAIEECKRFITVAMVLYSIFYLFILQQKIQRLGYNRAQSTQCTTSERPIHMN